MRCRSMSVYIYMRIYIYTHIYLYNGSSFSLPRLTVKAVQVIITTKTRK